MRELLSREEFGELIVNVAGGLTDDVMINGNPDVLLDPLAVAYSVAMDRIEELEGAFTIREPLRFRVGDDIVYLSRGRVRKALGIDLGRLAP